MRINVIIIIILILVPAGAYQLAGISQGTNSAPSTTVLQKDMNFTSMARGSYPSNRSWIGFSSYGNDSSYHAGIQDGGYSNGLLVSTSANSLDEASYLSLMISAGSTFDLKMTFSVSYSNNLFYSGDTLSLNGSLAGRFSYSFGPDYNGDTLLNAPKPYSIGSEPSPDSYYTLHVQENGNSSTMFTGITYGWNSTLHDPYALGRSAVSNTQALTLNIGGGYSNITIENIYLGNSSQGYFLEKSGDALTYSSNMTVAPWLASINLTGAAQPLVDWTDNSLLFLQSGNSHAVYSYNFRTNRTSRIISLGTQYSLAASCSTLNTAYFLFKETSGSVLYTMNFTTGSIEGLPVNLAIGGPTHILASAGMVYIFNAYGSAYALNPGRSYLYNLSLAGDMSLVSAALDNGSVNLAYLDYSDGHIIDASIHVNSVLVSNVTYNFSRIGPEVNLNSSSLHIPISVVESGQPGNISSPLIIEGNHVLPEAYPQGFQIVPSSGNTLALDRNGAIFLSRNNFYHQTNLAGKFTYLSFSPNFNRGIALTRSSITEYRFANTSFLDGNLTITFSPPSLLRGNVSLSYMVESQVSYTVGAAIGNLTILPSDGFMNFTTTILSNGPHYIRLTVATISGYNATVTRKVYIDNYVPAIELDPGENSTVLERSNIEAKIIGIPAGMHAEVSLSNGFNADYSTSQFNITAPGTAGVFSLLVNVTDTYGFTTHFVFTYRAEAASLPSNGTNIPYGSYLPSGNFLLAWSHVDTADNYTLRLLSAGMEQTLVVRTNQTNLSIGSGTYLLSISASLPGGTIFRVANETFTVQDFNPALTVEHSQGYYYSFYGNSPENSVWINASTNVTAAFTLNVSSSGDVLLSMNGNGNTFNHTLEAGNGIFRTNGVYLVNMTAMEKSGRKSYYDFSFSLNNTMPGDPFARHIYYYNTSIASLPFLRQYHTSYSYTIGNSSSQQPLTGSALSLVLGRFNTSVTVSQVTEWGNSGSVNLTLIYSSDPPMIIFTSSSNTLVWSNATRLQYRISDYVPLRSVVLEYGNRNITLGNGSRGSFEAVLKHDGNHTFALRATDLCGNTNISSSIDVVCEYYPEIGAIQPTVHALLGLEFVSSGISGSYLQSVNITWTQGSSVISHKGSFSAFVLPGEHNVTLEVSYHGTDILVYRHYFTLGFLPEIGVAVLLVSFALNRSFRGSRDTEAARKLIMECIGSARNDILKSAGKRHLNRRNVWRTILEMSSAGEISLMNDPDGVIYVMEPSSKNN